MKITEQEKIKIDNMRKSGFGYRRIARFLGLNVGAVKYYIDKTQGEVSCKVVGLKIKDLCPNCGVPVIQTPHKRRKIYCSDRCRLQAWHQKHYQSKS